ncbi:amino acid--tRNA ligase-related protein [Candidatus Carsonella ruddii]|uniref:Lysyl-tRNA synthetase n=1 Tax=Candidatus Carsonella ruddii (Diaphorina cf. continua) TaxID=2661587 RepID=A0A7R6VYE8_CARRU|nr:amino acid--tRNA ligase-related protein [Candidatus Carsonella ruddii (Diaphorina cf. continua)]BCG49357.1 lysine--tRNA ligase [Candidatus Carsonella ruddii (Diaphorina cf. continua)]
MIINLKNYKIFFGKITRIKNSFIEIKDYSGKIQIYCKKKFSLGDIIMFYGKLKKTKKKFFFLIPFYIKLVIKNLKICCKKLYIKETFSVKNFLFNYLKKFSFIFLNSTNFCKNKSNSYSNNFKTYSFCKKKFIYLKISPEFYIKKIISNNYNRVFDITKCYRNEGTSNIHNFEFNMLEYYSSNFTFYKSIFFLEKLIKNIFYSANYYFLELFKIRLSFFILFKKIYLLEILLIYFLKNNFFFVHSINSLFLFVNFIGIKTIKNYFKSDIYFKIFNKKILQKIIFPIFLINFPRKSSPLTKILNLNINYCNRFELFMLGIEISNGFEELNDYFIQKNNLFKKNKDFLIDIKNCLYNMNGVGVGVDRLILILLKIKHIKKII